MLKEVRPKGIFCIIHIGSAARRRTCEKKQTLLCRKHFCPHATSVNLIYFKFTIICILQMSSSPHLLLHLQQISASSFNLLISGILQHKWRKTIKNIFTRMLHSGNQFHRATRIPTNPQGSSKVVALLFCPLQCGGSIKEISFFFPYMICHTRADKNSL